MKTKQVTCLCVGPNWVVLDEANNEIQSRPIASGIGLVSFLNEQRLSMANREALVPTLRSMLAY